MEPDNLLLGLTYPAQLNGPWQSISTSQLRLSALNLNNMCFYLPYPIYSIDCLNAYPVSRLTGHLLIKHFSQTNALSNLGKKKIYVNETKILCFSSLDGENTDKSTDGPPPDFTEERVDELLTPDKEDKAEEDGMDVDEMVDEQTSDADISSASQN